MADSINNNIPFVPENVVDPAAGTNDAINVIDALLQVAVESVGVNTPPGSPVAGSRYVVGTSPTGAWASQANKLARYQAGAWQFFNARMAVNLGDNRLWIRGSAGWVQV